MGLSRNKAWCPLLVLALSVASDALAEGPMRMVKDINPTATSTSAPGGFTGMAGKLFFAATTFPLGRELWVSDGTEDGTTLVKDFRPGSTSSFPKDLFELHGALLFTVSDGVVGREWWTSDGTAAGSRLLKDILPGPSGGIQEGNAQTLTPAVLFQDRLYFRANDGISGGELWRTDGTEAGTVLFKDINPGSASGFPNGFVVVGDVLYFFASEPEHGFEVWKSDGTEAGTRVVKDITLGPAGSVNTPLAGVDDRFYFSADDGLHGVELWVTDGSEEGTWLVKDLNPGSSGSHPGNAAVLDGLVLFNADDGAHGLEIWRSDGTEEGTILTKDVYPGPDGSVVHDPVTAGSAVFWGAYEPEHSGELWSSDGTEEGTVMAPEINAGPGDASIGGLMDVHGTLLFNADDGVSGYGLWRTAGRGARPVPVQSIFTMEFSPGISAVVGSRLYVAATDIVHGTELWTGRAAIVAGQPARAFQDLIAEVEALHLSQGLEASLVSKLRAASRQLRRATAGASALHLLDAFEREIAAHTPAPISAGAAANLAEFAREIGELLGGVQSVRRIGPTRLEAGPLHFSRR